MSFAIKSATGGTAYATSYYIDWPAPHLLPGLRWWPVLTWACAYVLSDGIRDAIQNPDDSDDIATIEPADYDD